jgi:hypothetical protein
MNEPVEGEVAKKPASKRFIFAALVNWILVWPIIMAAIAVGLLVAGGQLFGESITEEQQSGSVVRGYFLLFLAIMVVICLLFSKLQKRNKHKFVSIGSPVLAVYMWLGMLFGGIILVNIGDGTSAGTNAGISAQTTSSIVVPPLEHDPEIIAVLQQIGATHIEAIDERYVDGYNEKLTDQLGKYQAYINLTTGDFLYGTLTVKRGQDKNQERDMIAHEYLHHVWFALFDEPTKQNLTSHLITLYGKDLWMQDRVKDYSDNGILQPTELFSYYCTESSDDYLTTYIKDTCNAYINRSALTMLR